MTLTVDKLSVTKLSDALGAEIRNVDLSQPVADDVFDQIIPDFPPEYDGIFFNLGRDAQPNHIYDVGFVEIAD